MKLEHRWSCEELGLPAHATLRCLLALPTGDLALGSDYDMLLWRRGQFLAFPFPEGARRESRRVESMAVFDGALHVATQRSVYLWPFRGVAMGRGHPGDGREGFDELRALHAAGPRLLYGWRTHLEGGEGPPDAISFATGWEGRVFAGSANGELWEVDGGLIRRFEARDRPQPVRQLAFYQGQLWVGAAGELHRWDGQRWRSEPGEPTAFVEADGRLYLLRDGGLWVADPEPRRLPETLRWPWALGSTPGRLWIGCRGGLLCFLL